MDFPRYTIRDLVNAEYKLLKEYLGFDHILAAIGVSLGGMKAYQFGISYPTYVSGLIPMGATPVTTPQLKILMGNLMRIIELDSGWHAGRYETNPIWAVNTTLWNFLVWMYSPEWFATNLKTEAGYRQWKDLWFGIFHSFPQDARDWYYTLDAQTEFSVGDTSGFNGDVEAALQSIRAQVLIIGMKDDMVFARDDLIAAKNTISAARYLELDTGWGHLGLFGWEPNGTKIMSQGITDFLSNLQEGGN